jgi:subtilisin family serine protease
VCGPGVDTISTDYDCWNYSTKSGTSMATPHVAGAAALALQANPNLDHFGMKQVLMDTAVDLGPAGWDNTYGVGRVDAYDAVVLAIKMRVDVNGDMIVDVNDLFAVINAWGPCDDCPEDITMDGIVDVDDLFEVINNWGPL